ncbi:MAG: hypothetical protein ACRDKW_04320, partial [Actinomycetota bacterium]
MSRKNALVEAGPWSTEYGNPQRTGAASVSASATGAVLWSAPLDVPWAEFSTSPDGRVLVATPGALVTFGPGGERMASLPCEPCEAPTLLTDGRMLLPEHDGTTGRLSVRDQRSGRLLATIPEWDETPAVSSDGLVIFAYRFAGRPSELRAFDLDGTFHWSTPLTEPEFLTPLLLDEWIVIWKGGYLKAFDYEGRPAWVAGRDGFRPPG